MLVIPYFLKNVKTKFISIDDYFVMALIPFFLGGFISYPFHNYYTNFLLISLIVLKFLLVIWNKFYHKKYHVLVVTYIIIIPILFFANEYSFYRVNKKMKEINELEKIGESKAALNLFDLEINENGLQSKSVLKYASLLASFRQYDSAIWVLLQNHKKCCSREFHLLLGDMYNYNNDSVNTQIHYINALYITPHKLLPRKKLMLFYQKYHNINKMKFWANEIIKTPLKVNTEKGNAIVSEAKKIL